MIIQPEAQLSAPKARREPIIIRTDLYAAILHENRLLHRPERESFAKVIVGGISVFVLAGAAHYFYLADKVGKLRPKAVEISERADFVERDLQNLRQRLQLQREKVARRSVLLGFAERRSPIAPLLERVLATTPSQIELTGLRVSCPNPEELSLLISGQTAARNGRLECDKFRLLLIQALQDTHLNPEGKFTRLEEIPRLNGSAITQFSIEVTPANAQARSGETKANPQKTPRNAR